MDKYKILVDVAKVFKLHSERRANIARDRITSDEPEGSSFLSNLTTEIMGASSLISDERYRIAVAELVVDFDTLYQIAKDKGDEAVNNLAATLEKESAVLVDLAWDAKEKAEWLGKISDEPEQNVLCLYLEKLTLFAPTIPNLPDKIGLSQL